MLKICLIAFSCLTVLHSFSQTDSNDNGSQNSDTINNKPKNTLLDTQRSELKIYPNPAKNKITVQVKGFDPGMVSVKIIDIKGKLFREDNRLLISGNEDLVMFLFLEPGIYFILITKKGRIARKKLIVL